MTRKLRKTSGGMSIAEFRTHGHLVLDELADFLATIDSLPVAPSSSAEIIRTMLGRRGLPEQAADLEALLPGLVEKLASHSLHNGHPRFWGYITSSANPVGILADLIASAINPNVALWSIAPVATEIEVQTIRWLAELVGYPSNSGGVLVSGGNMANFVGFLTARHAKAEWSIRETGHRGGPRMMVYVSSEAHTWVDKASDLFGLGSENVRWIPVDDDLKLRIDLLKQSIAEDLANDCKPFMVVGTAGTVGTGAIDPLNAIADICESMGLWYHIDGAYGAFSAALPDAPQDLSAIARADSVALDPHKWLYAPLEVGCCLVKDERLLPQTFSHNPSYLDTDTGPEDDLTMFVDRGPQNSRGFRALKVWLGLLASGAEGVRKNIEEDIGLSRYMADVLSKSPNIEVLTQSLSITTFRYVPTGTNRVGSEESLNRLNRQLLERIQRNGQVFVSQATIGEKFALRACIVNFRTVADDIHVLERQVVTLGAQIHEALPFG